MKMIKLKSFSVALCLALLIVAANAIHVRRNSGTLQSELENETEQFHRITLKRNELSNEQKKQSIQLLATAQNYSYNKRDYSEDMDFISNQKEKADIQKSSSSTSAHTVRLYNFKNVQYTGEISIGELGNTFNVIYDTGSANIWINSKHCKDAGCVNHKQYDSSSSPNYKKIGLNLDVQFGTGELIGEFSQDTIFFGDIEVQNQEFAEIFEEKGGVFVESHFDGIVGLAFPSMAAYNKNPLFDNLMKQKRVANNLFAFYMSPKNGRTDSEITVGGVDPSKYTGNINYHKVLKDYYWLVAAQNILVGGKDIGLCTGGCYVIADTGTSLITGPTNFVYKLLDKLNVDSGCKNVASLPDITFILDGISYTLTGEEYVLRDSDGITQSVEAAKVNLEMGTEGASCAPSLMPLDIPNDEDNFAYEKSWILGDTFLQKFYSVYDRDLGRVGFALSKHSAY